MGFIVEQGEKHYRLVAPDKTEGDLVEYGEIADVEYMGETYIACCDMEGEDEVVSILPGDAWVVKIVPAVSSQVDVQFSDTDEGEEVDAEIEEDDEDEDGDEEDGKGDSD